MTRKVLNTLAVLFFPVIAAAAPITVHNTGVDASDVVVGAGQATAFWRLLSAPIGATEAIGSNPFAYFHPAYAADSATSKWVSPNASGNASVSGPGGPGDFSALYVYELQVDLTGFVPSSAVIAGAFATDNTGFIRLNGGPSVATSGYAGFGSLTSFILNSGFVAGVNSVQVGVYNQGNPTALRVQITSATADAGTEDVPEPASVALVGLGVVAIATRRRFARPKS